MNGVTFRIGDTVIVRQPSTTWDGKDAGVVYLTITPEILAYAKKLGWATAPKKVKR